MDKPQDLLLDALNQPIPALSYYVTRRLKALYTGRAIIEGVACGFDLQGFAEAGHCTLRLVRPDILNQVLTTWSNGQTDRRLLLLGGRYLGTLPTPDSNPLNGVHQHFHNVWYAVDWEGHTLDALLMTWPKSPYGDDEHFWLVADSQRVAERFYEAVCSWSEALREEVLVFAEGQWRKDQRLFAAIQNTRLDSLILADNLKEEIRTDIERFLKNEEEYVRLGVAWKRGILLTGPPGNGKTHCVKALVNHLGISPLYVKSFKVKHYQSDHDSIRAVFAQARRTTPCILVLEDLDSLVTEENRSFFLNEMDGFADNHGILTIATTNHPERLDPAILERPSRFDRQYHFDMPGLTERAAYFNFWNETLAEELRLDEETIAGIAEGTGGFSFAMLKEVCVSSLLRWVGEPEAPTGWAGILQEQIDLLSKQIRPVAALDS